jgi:hypothetical protein
MTLSKINIKDFGYRCLMAFILLLPIYYNNLQYHGYKTMRLGHEQFFQLGITALFVITFMRNVWLAAFMIWSIFLYAYYNFPGIGGNYVMNLFMAAVLYQVTYEYVNEKRVREIFLAIMFLCGLNLFFTWLQLHGADPVYMSHDTKIYNYDPVGIMGIKAVSGVFSAICIPIALFMSPFLVLMAIPTLYISASSSAFVAAIASFLFMLYFKSRKVFLLVLLPLLLVGGLYVKNDSKANMMTDRYNLWKISMRDALQRPIVGMGLDSFRNVGLMKPFLYFKDATNNNALRMKYAPESGQWIPPKGYPIEYKVLTDESGMVLFNPDGSVKQDPLVNPWDHPHNEFVSVIYEFGIIGLLLLIALIWDMARRFKPEPILITLGAVFIVYLVSSTGQFPFHLARTAYLSVVFLACYYKLTDKGENDVR